MAITDARMIGSTCLQITREQVYPYSRDRIVVPTLREGRRTVAQPDVWYFDNREPAIHLYHGYLP